jgi:hypothetical protein
LGELFHCWAGDLVGNGHRQSLVSTMIEKKWCLTQGWVHWGVIGKLIGCQALIPVVLSGITKGGESLLKSLVLPLDVGVGLGMVRGNKGHLGLQFLPQELPNLSNELRAQVTMNDLG